jgi:hypothetical protein
MIVPEKQSPLVEDLRNHTPDQIAESLRGEDTGSGSEESRLCADPNMFKASAKLERVSAANVRRVLISLECCSR